MVQVVSQSRGVAAIVVCAAGRYGGVVPPFVVILITPFAAFGSV